MIRTFKLVLCALILGIAVTACGGGSASGAAEDKLTVVGSGS